MNKQLIILLCGAFCGMQACWVQGAERGNLQELRELSLEELMDVPVISVSKKTQTLSKSAAAVFVLTKQDIKNSGAQSIADLLRTVPGVQVANINAYAHAISIRGFNSSFANKLLVLVDGRSVYKPDFSGVYWESVDVPLDDIERIEVIRGPGSSVWGANAVNGVINIITQSAHETQGGLVSAAVGDGAQSYQVSSRYGGQINDDTAYRIYQKSTANQAWPAAEAEDNLPIHDQWRQSQIGVRIDKGNEGDTDQLMLNAHGFSNRLGEDQAEFAVAQVETTGGHVLGRWQHRQSEDSQWQLQAYYDYTKRDDPSFFIVDNQLIDIELQHQRRFLTHHELVWGLGYQQNKHHVSFGPIFGFEPAERTSRLYSLFAQAEFQLLPNTLSLIAGSKFEHHEFTGWEVQPSVHLNWQPHENTSLWAGISRAVRTPSRYEHDSFTERSATPIDYDFFGVATDSPFSIMRRGGQSGVQAENLLAYELGARHRFNTQWFVDTALFYNRYRDLILVSTDLHEDVSTGGMVLDSVMVNGMQAESYGAELALNWLPSSQWHVLLSYSWINLDVTVDDNIASELDYKSSIETRTPEQQFSLRSDVYLNPKWTWNTQLRYVDELPAANLELMRTTLVEAYWALDMRLAWQATPNIELSLVGRNLLEQVHREFAGEALTLYFRNDVERSVYGQVRWQF